MAKDLTGQRFGKLVVIGLDPDPYLSPGGKKTRRWICHCDCGNIVRVLHNALMSKNGTKSCGCLRTQSTRDKSKDMTGQRFGRLLVVGPADLPKKRANGQTLGWLCRCDCGSSIITDRKSLLSGKKLSCGCLLSESSGARVNDAVGHIDGTQLTAIRLDRPPNRNNKSGVKGVSWIAREGRWKACITFQRRQIYLGRFTNLEDAAAARKAAEEKYFSPVLDKYSAK